MFHQAHPFFTILWFCKPALDHVYACDPSWGEFRFPLLTVITLYVNRLFPPFYYFTELHPDSKMLLPNTSAKVHVRRDYELVPKVQSRFVSVPCDTGEWLCLEDGPTTLMHSDERHTGWGFKPQHTRRQVREPTIRSDSGTRKTWLDLLQAHRRKRSALEVKIKEETVCSRDGKQLVHGPYPV